MTRMAEAAGQSLVSGSEFDLAAKCRKSVHEEDAIERRLSGGQRGGLRGQHLGDGAHVPQSANHALREPNALVSRHVYNLGASGHRA